MYTYMSGPFGREWALISDFLCMFSHSYLRGSCKEFDQNGTRDKLLNAARAVHAMPRDRWQ